MVVDKLVEQTIAKKNPCIVGIDPMWQRLPQVYTRMGNPSKLKMFYTMLTNKAVGE